MADIFLNLAERYAAAFGSFASANEPRAVSVSGNGNNYGFEFYGNRDEDFENVSMIFEDTEVKFASVPFTNTRASDSILAPPPIISFSQDKDLIETPINGSDNVVVERWGTKPWEMRIRGLLIDVANRQYPSDQIKKLRKLFAFNNVIDVEGTQFAEKDIQSIYFKSISIDPLQGYQDTVQFTLKARSSVPVGFSLNKPN